MRFSSVPFRVVVVTRRGEPFGLILPERPRAFYKNDKQVRETAVSSFQILSGFFVSFRVLSIWNSNQRFLADKPNNITVYSRSFAARRQPTTATRFQPVAVAA